MGFSYQAGSDLCHIKRKYQKVLKTNEGNNHNTCYVDIL